MQSKLKLNDRLKTNSMLNAKKLIWTCICKQIEIKKIIIGSFCMQGELMMNAGLKANPISNVRNVMNREFDQKDRNHRNQSLFSLWC